MKFFSLECKLCGKLVKYTINHIWKHHKDVWNDVNVVESPNGILFEVEEQYFIVPKNTLSNGSGVNHE